MALKWLFGRICLLFFVVGAVLAATPAPASTAAAEPEPDFSCRASALRLLSTEPVVSNPATTPCTDGSSGGSPLNLEPLNVTSLHAETSAIRASAPATTTHPIGGQATAAVLGLEMPFGGFRIHADALTADAVARCDGGTLVLNGGSAVVGLTIDGMPLPPSEPQTIPLGGIGTLHVNHVTVEPSRIVHRALWLQTITGDFVVAEAVGGIDGRCIAPGVLNIIVENKSGIAEDFLFRGDFGDFLLDDDPDGQLPRERSFTTRPGTYVIRQELPSTPAQGLFEERLRLFAIACTDPDRGTVVDVANASATIDLDPGETVNCSFQNALTRFGATIAIEPQVERNLVLGPPSVGEPDKQSPRRGAQGDGGGGRTPNVPPESAPGGLPVLPITVSFLTGLGLVAAFLLIGFVRRRSE